jgi:hypothetical protein
MELKRPLRYQHLTETYQLQEKHNHWLEKMLRQLVGTQFLLRENGLAKATFETFMKFDMITKLSELP